MIALLQRVEAASVSVDGRTVGEIGPGLCAFVCAEPGDDARTSERLVERLLAFRMFADGAGKTNLSLRDTAGGLLIVPQFTLAADTTRGNRPSFSSAAQPDAARELFDHLCLTAASTHAPVASGRFGEHMKVRLVNDGPVTFWLRLPPAGSPEPRSQNP